MKTPREFYAHVLDCEGELQGESVIRERDRQNQAVALRMAADVAVYAALAEQLRDMADRIELKGEDVKMEDVKMEKEKCPNCGWLGNDFCTWPGHTATDAIPDAPVSGTVGPRALMTPAEEVAIEALQRIHNGATLPQFIANQALGRIEHVILLSAPRSPPDDAVVGHDFADSCSACGGAHVVCNGLPAAPMTAERRAELVELIAGAWLKGLRYGVVGQMEDILDALIKAGAVR